MGFVHSPTQAAVIKCWAVPHAVPLTWPACLSTTFPNSPLRFPPAMRPLLSTAVFSKINNPSLLYFYPQTSNLLFLTLTQPVFIWVEAFQTVLPERLPVISGVWPCLIQPALSHVQDTAILPGTCYNFHQCVLILFVMFSNFLMSCPIFFCVPLSIVSLKSEPGQGSCHYLSAALSFSADLAVQIHTTQNVRTHPQVCPRRPQKCMQKSCCLCFFSRMKRSWDTFVNFINRTTRHGWTVTRDAITEQIQFVSYFLLFDTIDVHHPKV